MTSDRPVKASKERDPKAHKAGLVMLGIFAVGCVLFVCGGAVGLGVSAANNSESEAVTLSYFILTPMGAAIAGMVTSIITHFAIKQSVAAKLAIPPIVALFTMPCVLGAMVVFYEAIWPSL